MYVGVDSGIRVVGYGPFASVLRGIVCCSGVVDLTRDRWVGGLQLCRLASCTMRKRSRKGSGLEKRLMRLGGGFGNNRHGEVESLLLLDLKAEVELASGAVAAAAPRKQKVSL